MIVAFTGGRDYQNRAMVHFVIALLDRCGDEMGRGEGYDLRVGDCPTGLDAMVREHANGTEVFDADWKTHGKAAGPIRNKAMLCHPGTKTPTVDLLIAFPGGKGTADCVRQARELGIAVIEVPA